MLDNVLYWIMFGQMIFYLTYVWLFCKIIYIKYLKVFYTNLVFKKIALSHKIYWFAPVYITENLIDLDTFITTQSGDPVGYFTRACKSDSSSCHSST